MNTEHIIMNDDLVIMRCHVSHYIQYSLIKTTDQIIHMWKGQNLFPDRFFTLFENRSYDLLDRKADILLKYYLIHVYWVLFHK